MRVAWWWMPRTSIAISGLLHVPEQVGRREDAALDVFSVGSLGLEHPGRDVGHGLERALLELHGELFAGVEVGRLDPRSAQLLDLVVLGPAEPGAVAVRPQSLVDRRVEHVRADPAGAEHVPPALGRRLLRGAAGDLLPPIHR